jgi:8-amino-7-oxononanoate synthase
LLNSTTSIQGVYVKGNIEGKNVEVKLKAKGIACKAILSPTVPKGKERLRVSIHAFNTQKEIDLLINSLAL